MNVILVIVTVTAHLIFPFVFLHWVAFNKGKNKLYKICVGVFVGSYFLTMWIGGAGWHWFGSWWPLLFLVLYVPAIVILVKNLNPFPWIPEKKFMPWLNTGTMAVLAIIFSIGLPEIFSYRSYEGEPLKLMFPVRSGTYHVVHGGSSKSMNHHFEVRAQKYALDILKVNKWGIRASGLMPTQLDAYEIFGEKVIAPCTGEVISVKNVLADNVPPKMDPDNLLGNHVILFCEGHSVLLAHLKKDSVPVETGDQVEQGSTIGEVGNTGNSSEPHLHIHAVRGKLTNIKEVAGSAKGIPMLFDDKFLIRNDQVKFLD